MDRKGKQELPPNYDSMNFNEDTEKLYSSSEDSDSEEPEYEGAVELLKFPAYPPCISTIERRTLTCSPPSLVYDDIQEACIRFVKGNVCYGSKFVREMNLADIKNDCAFHYTLETFCEKRELALVCIPYNGQFIDGPEYGPPPAPWDVHVEPPALFQNGKSKVEIPHTTYVKPCALCMGNGRIRCKKCSGIGRSMCHQCHGNGGDLGDTCELCGGKGRKWCGKCKGHGQVKCKRCDGRGNLKCFRILIVTWLTFPEEFFSNTYNLPPELVKTVKASKMLSEEDQMVTPIANAPDESINAASLSFVNGHREKFRNKRIVKQRHVLRAVPLTKASYQWRSKKGEIYVYGNEEEVYFPDYPQKCCNCTCL